MQRNQPDNDKSEWKQLPNVSLLLVTEMLVPHKVHSNFRGQCNLCRRIILLGQNYSHLWVPCVLSISWAGRTTATFKNLPTNTSHIKSLLYSLLYHWAVPGLAMTKLGATYFSFSTQRCGYFKSFLPPSSLTFLPTRGRVYVPSSYISAGMELLPQLQASISGDS